MPAANPLSRRRFLIGALGVGAAVVGARAAYPVFVRPEPALRPVGPGSDLVRSFEERRQHPGASVVDASLIAAPAVVALAGRQVRTWAYDGQVPGPEIRVRAGDVLRARLRNGLPVDTTIHWHGIALRNDMDGVPGLTQDPVLPGGEFLYDFVVPDAGTYFFHPHVGTQLDRGLYAPLIVEDPAEPGAYDREYVVVLDDWIDGLDGTPDEQLDRLRRGASGMGDMDMDGGMGDMDMDGGMGDAGGTTGDGAGGETTGDGAGGEEPSGPLGDDTGDVAYPRYLVNGRPPADPPTFEAGPGERIRFRIVNAGSDTPFRVALGGHRLTVTHTDGFPVEPVTVDALIVGMGERYDVLVSVAGAGAYPLVAAAEGKAGGAFAVLRSGAGAPPAPTARPAELKGRLLAIEDLRAAPDHALAPAEPDLVYEAVLTGDMETYRWGIEPDRRGEITLPASIGQRIRLAFENRTAMWHPLHVHGHTFEVRNGSVPGPRKDTVIVPAMDRVTVDIEADNPGRWAIHCHNIYHAEVGMQTVLSYVG